MTDPSTPPPHETAPPDIGPAGIRAALALATAFLTRLPVPGHLAGGPLAPVMAAFPAVGAGLGLAAGLAMLVAGWLGLGPWPAALIALAVPMLLTGALHEDGLADTADGLGGGGNRERALEMILKIASKCSAVGPKRLVIRLGFTPAPHDRFAVNS